MLSACIGALYGGVSGPADPQEAGRERSRSRLTRTPD